MGFPVPLGPSFVTRSLRPFLLACLALPVLIACQPSIPDPQPTPIPRPAQTAEPVLPEMGSYVPQGGSAGRAPEAVAPPEAQDAQGGAQARETIANNMLPTVVEYPAHLSQSGVHP